MHLCGQGLSAFSPADKWVCLVIFFHPLGHPLFGAASSLSFPPFIKNTQSVPFDLAGGLRRVTTFRPPRRVQGKTKCGIDIHELMSSLAAPSCCTKPGGAFSS